MVRLFIDGKGLVFLVREVILVWEMFMVPWLRFAGLIGLARYRFGIILSLEMGRELIFWVELILLRVWTLKGKLDKSFADIGLAEL